MPKLASLCLSEIAFVEPCQIASPYLLRARAVNGVRLKLRDGRAAAFPLDFPRGREISARLAAAAWRPGA